jgi:intein-encoded DNA endonuclease-like protein
VPSRAGVKLRPTVEREGLYRLVLQLRKEGLSYNKIIRKIQSDQGVTLRKSHISEWVNKKHEPFGYVRLFEPTPCPELAYIIGVKFGDASMSVNKNHCYIIKLRVTDKDFAEEFARCLSMVLKRESPHVRWHEKTHAWHVDVASILLQNFLKQRLSKLRPTIEHCDACKGAFLRGFFDSEGSITGRKLVVYNGDIDKLKLVRQLLESLGIGTTGPHLRESGGGVKMIKQKLWHVNKNSYYVYVRVGSLQGFRDKVRFAIARKQARLESAVGILCRPI